MLFCYYLLLFLLLLEFVVLFVIINITFMYLFLSSEGIRPHLLQCCRRYPALQVACQSPWTVEYL